MPKNYISSAATWIFVHSLLRVKILGILTCMCVFTTSAGCVTKLAKNPAPVKSFVFSKSSWHESYWHTKTSGSCFNEDNCKLLTKACHDVASVGRGFHPAWNLLLQHLIGSQIERGKRHIPVQKKQLWRIKDCCITWQGLVPGLCRDQSVPQSWWYDQDRSRDQDRWTSQIRIWGAGVNLSNLISFQVS